VRAPVLFVLLLLPLAAIAKVPASVADSRPGPGVVTPDFPHHDLEVMYAEGQIDQGLAAARQRLAANPSDVELYRHVARFMFEQAEIVDKNEATFDKAAHYQEMYDLLNKALTLDPGNAHLLFNRGVALGRLSTTRGVMSSIANLKSVEADWLASAGAAYRYRSLDGGESMPCSAYLTLGIFYRLVPDSWIVGVIAGVRGDLDKSLMWLEKADTCHPNRIGIVKELGATQLCIGETRKQPEMTARGKATLGRVLAMPPSHTTGALDQKHAAKMIGDPSLACSYSRDGQVEIDRKEIEAREKSGK